MKIWHGALGGWLFLMAFGPNSLAGVGTAAKSKGFLISIDGFAPEKMRALLREGALTSAHGFRWLDAGALRSDRAWPATVTLTAPSHVSILTCSSPARHGVVANNFLRAGVEANGFAASIDTETLVEAARRQHRRVLSLGYASVDGTDERRRADAGITYPDALYTPPSRVQPVAWESLTPAQGWIYDGHVPEATDARELALSSVLNPVTGEKLTLNLLFYQSRDAWHVVVARSKDLSRDFIGETSVGQHMSPIIDAFAVETNAQSPLLGYKRRVSLRFRLTEAKQLSVYVAGASYNNAHPEAFRQALDQANLIWPTKHAVLGQEDPVAYVEEMAVVDRFLTDAARFAMARYPHDLVLFYQPLIDSTGHAYEGLLPATPFSGRATDKISQAFARAFAIVDENLDRLLAQAGPQDAIVLSGDHGMDPVRQVVNVTALRPEGAEGRLLASGAMLMLYPEPGQGADKVTAAGEALATALRQARYQGQVVLGEVFDARQAAPGQWAYGDARWVYTPASTFWFQVYPNDKRLFIDPATTNAWGMHGHALSNPRMATGVLARLPGQAPRDLGEVSLLQVVPSLAKAIGIQAPAQCEAPAWR